MAAGQQDSLNLSNVAEYTVTQLANRVKRTLEDTFGHVRIRAEISGYRGPHSSGHCYFALKDEKARIDAVIWKGVFNKLKIKPEEGMEVIATGKVSSYPGSSKYQIVLESLEPAGVGALMALLEERKKKLAAEGLFADERKKPRPFLPKSIGIVTSPTGAVIRDMMHGFTERFPAKVVVWPVRVQGDTCAQEVAAAVRGFNALGEGSIIERPELLIVARGGGSLEDLWGFNEEIVARAVAESEIPVISAVGHETDWTIIDLVADARAPTPTKAAEWAVPKYSELIDRVGELDLRLHRTMHRFMEHQRSQLKGLQRALPRLQDLVALPRQRLDAASSRLAPAFTMRVSTSRNRLTEISGRLSPALTANAHRKRTQYLALEGRFTPVLAKSLNTHKLSYQKLASRLVPTTISHRISQGTQRTETLGLRADRAVSQLVHNLKSELNSHTKLLNSLGYKNVLKRGYALVRDADGKMIRATGVINSGQTLDLELSDGHVSVTAGEVSAKKEPQPEIQTPPKTAKPKKRKSEPESSDQGSLF